MVYDLRHPQLRPRGESSKLAQWPESSNFVHQLSCLFLFRLFLKEMAKIPQKTLIKGAKSGVPVAFKNCWLQGESSRLAQWPESPIFV